MMLGRGLRDDTCVGGAHTGLVLLTRVGTLFLQERTLDERGLCSVKTNQKESVKRPELVGVPVVHGVQ